MSHALRHRIGTPETAHRVASPEEYRRWVLAHHVAQGGHRASVRRSGLALDAYVSDGRWVVQCPCGNCPSAHPEWRIAACVECGAIHDAAFPRDWRAGEMTLLARAEPHHRHWFPSDAVARRHGREGHEIVAALRRENRERGLLDHLTPEQLERRVADAAEDQRAAEDLRRRLGGEP